MAEKVVRVCDIDGSPATYTVRIQDGRSSWTKDPRRSARPRTVVLVRADGGAAPRWRRGDPHPRVGAGRARGGARRGGARRGRPEVRDEFAPA
jgi:hypothetical protein